MAGAAINNDLIVRNLKIKLEKYENGKAIQELEDRYIREIEKRDRKIVKLEQMYAKLKKELEDRKEQIKELKEEKRMMKDLNKDLNKKIRKAEKEVDTVTKTNISLRDDLSKTKKEYSQLSAHVCVMEKENRKARETIDTLKEQIKKEQSAVARDNTNSSSTARPQKKKIPNSRQKSGRKPGAQKGHSGCRRPDLPATLTTLLAAPKEVQENPDDYELVENKQRSRKLLEVRLELDVNEVVSRCWRNKKTGKLVYAEFPDALKNELNYGASVKAFMYLMHSLCNVSVRKAGAFFEALSGSRFRPSAGWICHLTREFSDRTEDDRMKIFRLLRESMVMNVDTTYIHVDGKLAYYQVSCTDQAILFQFRKKKGEEAVKGTPVEFYTGTAVHDHDCTYYGLKLLKGHQECLAHLIRYCQGAHDNNPDMEWPLKMKNLLQEMIHERNEGRLNTGNKAQELKDRYREILELGKTEFQGVKIDRYNRDDYNLLKRLGDYEKQTLYFLDHPEINPTNNLAEAGARVAKRWERCSGGHRSAEYAAYRGNGMSIIQTMIKQDQNVYSGAIEIFERENY